MSQLLSLMYNFTRPQDAIEFTQWAKEQHLDVDEATVNRPNPETQVEILWEGEGEDYDVMERGFFTTERANNGMHCFRFANAFYTDKEK